MYYYNYFKSLIKKNFNLFIINKLYFSFPEIIIGISILIVVIFFCKTTENFLEVVKILPIPLIPTIGWIYTEKKKREFQRYLFKEQRYSNLCDNIEAVLLGDLRYPDTQEKVEKFILELRKCYLHSPKEVIEAGNIILEVYQEIITLTDIRKSKLLTEYETSNLQQKLKALRNEHYPEFLKVIRQDMMALEDINLKEKNDIVESIFRIKFNNFLKSHCKYKLAHLILLMVDAREKNDILHLRVILQLFKERLKKVVPNLESAIDNKGNITIILSDGDGKKTKIDIVSFLDQLSLTEVFGLEKAWEIKKQLERRYD